MLTWTIAAEHTPEVGKESSNNVKETGSYELTKSSCGQWFPQNNGSHVQCRLQLQGILRHQK